MKNRKSKKVIILSVSTIFLLVTTMLIVYLIPVWGTEKIKCIESIAPYILDMQLEKEGRIKDSLKICDEFSLSFDNNDNSQTLYLFATPVAFKDIDNNLTLIDNKFISISDQTLITQGYIYKNAKNSIDVLYPDSLSKNKGILLKTSDTTIEISPDTSSSLTSLKTDIKDMYDYITDGIQYNNAFGDNTSFNCFNTVLGMQGDIVLTKYTGQNIFKFIIKAPGLIPDNSNNLYKLLKNPKDDAITAVFYPPFARDSYNRKRNEENSHFSYMNQISLNAIDQQKGIYSLTLIIDEAFLKDKNTVYPVKINPSFYMYKKKQPDSSVYSNFDNTNQYLSNFSGTGNCTYYGNGRTYVRFECLQNYSLLPDKIISAYYHTFEFTGYKSTAEIGIYNVIKPWCSLGSKWNNKSEYGDKVSDIKGQDQNNYEFDLTNLVKKWMVYNRDPKNGLDPMRGFLLKDINETNTWRMFSSADNGYQIPYLQINFKK